MKQTDINEYHREEKGWPPDCYARNNVPYCRRTDLEKEHHVGRNSISNIQL